MQVNQLQIQTAMQEQPRQDDPVFVYTYTLREGSEANADSFCGVSVHQVDLWKVDSYRFDALADYGRML